jgi:hypothetical protein
MYIVSKLLQRALETSQRELVTSVIATVSRVLGSDFVGMIQRKMRDESYPRSSSSSTPPPDEKVLQFLVLINNLDTAAEYLHRIIAGLDLRDLFPFEDDAGCVEDALKNLGSSFDAKTAELVGDGVKVVFNLVVKPRLRPLLAESWSGVEYVVSSEEVTVGGVGGYEDEGPDVDGGELVKARFQRGWEALMNPLKRIMTEKTFQRLLVTTADYFSKLLEKRIWGYSGRINELGAIRLERDVAGVVGVVVRGGRYGVRDMFSRCTQICLVVNMEEDEVREILKKGGASDEGGVEWKLEVEERARAREMVVR